MKAIIIEDESLVARELENTLKEVAPDVDIVEIIPSLKVARKWFLYNAEPDLIFMDIQLSDGISFVLFDQFKLQCPVVFATAYDEYAVRAFKVNGIDYILKPVEKDELKRAVDKCRAIVGGKSPYPVGIEEFLQAYKMPSSQAPVYKEKFIVHKRNHWIPVNTKDVACFYKDSLFYLYTFAGEKYILDFESMEDIEEVVDPRQFYRANRQAIVNIDAIRSVLPKENSKLILSLVDPLKMEIDISREKAPAFKKWFDR